MLYARAPHVAAKQLNSRIPSRFRHFPRAAHHAIQAGVAWFAAIHRYFFITD
jgi:hypothetical protein